jgi:hypothetical protein
MEHLLKLSTAIFSKFTFINKYIPIDKQMHFLSGALGSLFLSFIIGYWAIFVISIIASLKEWYDYLHPTLHTADIWDWIATTLGSLIILVNYVW